MVPGRGLRGCITCLDACFYKGGAEGGLGLKAAAGERVDGRVEWAESDHERTPCRREQPSSPLRQAELVTRAKEPTSPRPSLIHTEIKGNNFLYILLARSHPHTSTQRARTHTQQARAERERERKRTLAAAGSFFCVENIISRAHWTAAAFSTHCSFSLSALSAILAVKIHS